MQVGVFEDFGPLRGHHGLACCLLLGGRSAAGLSFQVFSRLFVGAAAGMFLLLVS